MEEGDVMIKLVIYHAPLAILIIRPLPSKYDLIYQNISRNVFHIVHQRSFDIM